MPTYQDNLIVYYWDDEQPDAEHQQIPAKIIAPHVHMTGAANGGNSTESS